jgi:hypothetical protein
MGLVKTVRFNIVTDVGDSRLKLDAIDRKATELGAKHPELKVKVDTAAAALKLKVLQHELKNTSTSSETLGQRFGALTKKIGEATPGWLGMASAASAFGPAVLPVLGAATAATIGLGAALAGAGSALGVFALAAKGNLTELQKQMVKVQAANKSANLAEQTAAKNRTAAQKQAIVNARQLTAAFNKEFGAEASAIEKLKSSWTSFTTQPVVSNTIAMGARLLTAVLPHLTPLLKLGANAVQAFAGALGGFTVGGGLDRLVAGLVKIGQVSLTGFLAILHNLAVAIGALGPGMGQFSTAVIGGLVKLSAAFAGWAQNKGAAAMAGFFASVKKSAPQVGQLLLSLVKIIPLLTRGLMPLAPLSLALSAGLARVVAALPPGVITAIAAAFVPLYIAMKTAALYTRLFVGSEKEASLWSGVMAARAKVVAAAQWLVNASMKEGAISAVAMAVASKATVAAQKMAAVATAAWGLAMDALPFVAIAAAVALLVVVIVKYHKQIWAFIVRIWHDVWNFIKQAWGSILSFAKQWWPLLLGPSGVIVKYHTQIWGFIQRIWHDVASFLVRTWNAVWGTARSVWGSIVGWFRGIPGRIVGALFGLGHRLYGFAHAALTEFWNGLRSVAGSIFSWVGNFVRTIWSKVKSFFGISSPSSLFYDIGKNLMLGLFHGIKDHAHLAANAASAAGGAASGALGGDQAANERLARRIFPWPASQWSAFYNLVMAESGFNRFARNPSSGAYGIAQALPPTKYPYAGQAAGGSHAGAQLSWMFSYIGGRYGSPANAWAHELNYHWYDQGGWLPPGISLAVNRTGYPEQVLPRGRAAAPSVVIQVGSGPPGDLDRALLTWIRRNVRIIGGGSVQVAFGGR